MSCGVAVALLVGSYCLHQLFRLYRCSVAGCWPRSTHATARSTTAASGTSDAETDGVCLLEPRHSRMMMVMQAEQHTTVVPAEAAAALDGVTTAVERAQR